MDQEIKKLFDLATNLRINLIQKNISIQPSEDRIYIDPLDEDFLTLMECQTKINEIFYWNVFAFYPHNDLKTISDVIHFQTNFELNEPFYYEHREKVSGVAQPFPVYFMKDQKDLSGYKAEL